jgi:DNA recombination protein RmuC
MAITYLILSLIGILLVINIVLTLRAGRKESGQELGDIKFSISTLTQNLKDSESNLKNEFAVNRRESADTAGGLRAEIGSQLNAFTQTFSELLSALTRSNEERLEAIRRTIEEKLLSFQTSIDTNSRESRSELKSNLESFKKELNDALKDYRERLREQFGEFEKNQQTQNAASNEKLVGIKSALETSVKSMQESNEAKLEEMRKTVDEKLEKTLETRLTQSFNLVSERLETVHKGLGEMQQLAVGVGDLKKVLSNVKTRGILGELQLSNILEQILAPEQYEINAITKKGTNNRVEFAIKIPQQNQDNKILLMPVDSKFPIEDYYTLLAAYEAGDSIAADAAGKALENAIKKAARDIHEKYIGPPDTSEIGLLFLPIEGLYAEAVRRPALMEMLQRDYQVILTGPTTLSAILSTISFGYKTMALEQRSGEIKKTLSAVKTEFGKFGDILKKAQEKINKASEDIDELVGARTKKINARLKSFEELPAAETKVLLDTNSDSDLTDDNEGL